MYNPIWIEKAKIKSTRSSSAWNEVLNILTDAARQYRPNGKESKDLDIAHVARHTSVMADLLRITKQQIATATESPEVRDEFAQTVESLQQILYPWITHPEGDDNRTYTSIFHLVNSFKEDVGIGICAGKNQIRWAIHQIITFRAILNSTLPVEIFYAGDEDLPAEYRQFIQVIQSMFPHSGFISTIDLTARFPDPDGILALRNGQWALRPFAALASSFKTVILVDADTIFLQDPLVLLREPSFEQYGSVFWHDRVLSPPTEETSQWVDELLEVTKAKNLEKVRDSGWFTRQTQYELERYALLA